MKRKNAPVLNSKHLTALRRAVSMAEEWRGERVGNNGYEESIRDEAERVAAFDAEIAGMKRALKAVSATIKQRVSEQRIVKRNRNGWPVAGGHP